jgi:hypothetical protein
MGKKILLAHDHVPGIQGYEVYRQNGGYASVEKAIKTMSSEALVEEVKKLKQNGIGGFLPSFEFPSKESSSFYWGYEEGLKNNPFSVNFKTGNFYGVDEYNAYGGNLYRVRPFRNF